MALSSLRDFDISWTRYPALKRWAVFALRGRLENHAQRVNRGRMRSVSRSASNLLRLVCDKAALRLVTPHFKTTLDAKRQQ